MNIELREYAAPQNRPRWLSPTGSVIAAGIGAALLAAAANVQAQDVPQALIGARIIPISGEEIDRGVLVVHLGKITAVGPQGTVAIPANANTIDASGKVIMPGLVCTHSHVGGFGGADGSHPIQPDVRIYDSLNVRHSGYKRVVAGGLTTINVMPGSGHLLSGQTIYLKMRGGNTIEELFYRDGDRNILGGLKMANGTNSQRKKPFPGTRGKSAALVRAKYVQAQEYRDKIKRAATA